MERWRDIKGFEGSYQVSDCGRVRSLPRNGTINEVRTLKPQLDKDGYLCIVLSTGKRAGKHTYKRIRVHQSVLRAFVADPQKGEQVHHINFIRDDNRLENLMWTTAKGNTNASDEAGRRKPVRGEDHGSSKITEEDVINIIKLSKAGKTGVEISQLFCVSRQQISRICNGTRWTHLDRETIQ